ncbi:anaphase promoting complex subunit 4 [Pycnococcus provasolii]|uniref:Anaphase promoting complex subunit 4 n=1 Tax=Pycnococcus provasolii TaxID=41880 RepID=A0A830HRV3_9CHLO|nr:anaphase promoting complex subunit 4 [Pycnococcus provasolii]
MKGRRRGRKVGLTYIPSHAPDLSPVSLLGFQRFPLRHPPQPPRLFRANQPCSTSTHPTSIMDGGDDEAFAVVREIVTSAAVHRLAWCHSMDLLAVATVEGAVAVYRLGGQRLWHMLSPGGARTDAIAWSPDGGKLALGRSDGTWAVHDSSTGSEVSRPGGVVRSWNAASKDVASSSSASVCAMTWCAAPDEGEAPPVDENDPEMSPLELLWSYDYDAGRVHPAPFPRSDSDGGDGVANDVVDANGSGKIANQISQLSSPVLAPNSWTLLAVARSDGNVEVFSDASFPLFNVHDAKVAQAGAATAARAAADAASQAAFAGSLGSLLKGQRYAALDAARTYAVHAHAAYVSLEAARHALAQSARSCAGALGMLDDSIVDVVHTALDAQRGMVGGALEHALIAAIDDEESAEAEASTGQLAARARARRRCHLVLLTALHAGVQSIESFAQLLCPGGKLAEGQIKKLLRSLEERGASLHELLASGVRPNLEACCVHASRVAEVLRMRMPTDPSTKFSALAEGFEACADWCVGALASAECARVRAARLAANHKAILCWLLRSSRELANVGISDGTDGVAGAVLANVPTPSNPSTPGGAAAPRARGAQGGFVARIAAAARAAAMSSRGLGRKFDVKGIAAALDEAFGTEMGDGASLLSELEEDAVTVPGGALSFAKRAMASSAEAASSTGGALATCGATRRAAVLEASVSLAPAHALSMPLTAAVARARDCLFGSLADVHTKLAPEATALETTAQKLPSPPVAPKLNDRCLDVDYYKSGAVACISWVSADDASGDVVLSLHGGEEEDDDDEDRKRTVFRGVSRASVSTAQFNVSMSRGLAAVAVGSCVAMLDLED